MEPEMENDEPRMDASGAMCCDWPRWKKTGILKAEAEEEEEAKYIDGDVYAWLFVCSLPLHNIPSFMWELGNLELFFWPEIEIHRFGLPRTELFWHALENTRDPDDHRCCIDTIIRRIGQRWEEMSNDWRLKVRSVFERLVALGKKTDRYRVTVIQSVLYADEKVLKTLVQRPQNWYKRCYGRSERRLKTQPKGGGGAGGRFLSTVLGRREAERLPPFGLDPVHQVMAKPANGLEQLERMAGRKRNKGLGAGGKTAPAAGGAVQERAGLHHS